MPAEYEKRIDEEGEPVICDSCHYAAPTAIFENEPRGGTRHFCQICSETFLSSPSIYLSLYSPAEQKLFSGVAWVGNRILDEIRSLKATE